MNYLDLAKPNFTKWTNDLNAQANKLLIEHTATDASTSQSEKEQQS